MYVLNQGKGFGHAVGFWPCSRVWNSQQYPDAHVNSIMSFHVDSMGASQNPKAYFA